MLWYRDRDSRSQGSAEIGQYVTDLGNDFAIPPSAQRLVVPETGVGSSTWGTGLLMSCQMGTGKVRRKWKKPQDGLNSPGVEFRGA